MSTLKQKLSSRKLWAMIVGVIIGIATIFGLDGGVIETVAGAVVSLVSLVSYMYTEGKIDAARVSSAVAQVQDAIGSVTEGE